MTNRSTRFFGSRATIVAAIISAWLPAATMAGPIAKFAPHRATYELSAGPRSASRDAQVLDGLMVFEFAADCEGHTLNDRTVIVLGSSEGQSTTIDSQYSAWESNDGTRLRFISTLKIDGNEIEAVRGDAELDEPGGAGMAHYVLPEKKDIELPSGTRFPVKAGLHSLGQIETGKRQLSYVLFDGSGSDGPSFATDFVISDPLIIEDGPPEGDIALLDAPSWRIRTAFFDLKDETAPPLSELDGQTHKNGIISGFILDTATFNAFARLVRIEALPEPAC